MAIAISSESALCTISPCWGRASDAAEMSSAVKAAHEVKSVFDIRSCSFRSVLLLFATGDLDIHALRHNIQELSVIGLSYDERIRLSLASRLQFLQLFRETIHQRMVLKLDIHFGLLRLFLKMGDGCQILLQACVRNDRSKKNGAAVKRGHMRLALIFHRENKSHGSWRVSGD